LRARAVSIASRYNYGAFYPTALRNLWRYMDHRLERWARRKYKSLQRYNAAVLSGIASVRC
jgi:hypothetical protein